MYVYFTGENDGVLATKEKKTDPRYKLIGTVNTTEELAELLKDEKFMDDYAGEISNAFKESER